jgi:hypothetical protein
LSALLEASGLLVMVHGLDELGQIDAEVHSTDCDEVLLQKQFPGCRPVKPGRASGVLLHTRAGPECFWPHPQYQLQHHQLALPATLLKVSTAMPQQEPQPQVTGCCDTRNLLRCVSTAAMHLLTLCSNTECCL